MTPKEKFIRMIEQEVMKNEDLIESYNEDWNDIQSFWNEFTTKREKNGVTELGKSILAYMVENEEPQTSKAIGQGMSVGSRTVSGAMRKLIALGLVKKEENTNPICYSLTDFGKEYKGE